MRKKSHICTMLLPFLALFIPLCRCRFPNSIFSFDLKTCFNTSESAGLLDEFYVFLYIFLEISILPSFFERYFHWT